MLTSNLTHQIATGLVGTLYKKIIRVCFSNNNYVKDLFAEL